MNGKKPLALYIHFPFCSKKCHYCSFYTIPYNPESVSLYCNAILQEGLSKLSTVQDTYFIDTVFFGGGTPSLIPPHHLHNISKVLAPHAKEITLEANPEDLSEAYLRDLTLTPVNRISVGAQTFHDPLLKALGRIHCAAASIDAVHRCYEHEFNNISIDLIYGLPTQSLSDFLSDLHQALTLPISHISLYNLTLDPHTSFYKHRRILAPSIANDDILAAMSLSAEELLSSRGFSRYELASYAKSQAESKHNLYYWTDKPFLGLGVSASQYTDNIRSKNFSRISEYLRAVRKNLPTHESRESLPEEERIKEALALRLRLTKGARLKDFPSSLIQSLTSIPLIKELFDLDNEFLFLNKQGRLFHDTIAEEIMNLSF
ncbi:Oxygen-independent coproporphyrinogen-III oxidase 2,coproporphyrinogen III oxidase,Putative heme iron utilization protein,putative oxygen-independent coproporphyrinogen III oxidase,HemN C-terminal region [Chlamydia poikilotherma]|uniref:Heme chaperone HemW n=1 Tax=Chlamydia poikilotherma TaxID=1967783 RepID=A0A3B0PSD2_9CHLA|nr:radical SAM family heme chaperone HemW [Chlamydia poikilotherma]SYX08901.1 Oxygen-independent coproporphyrinogen-III oxidase 2,coproporphyrinogen III oxidase,Putative heme iron utilization protein,putative oxygen-independent coproporphyrinogen III oxidase,HemN C-terminal region [Chlamydia poikilotherma]